MIIKLILIIIFLISLPSLSFAQSNSKEIRLRIGKHQNFYRIVFYLDNEEIKNLINLKSAKDNKIRISIPKETQIEFQGKILSDMEKINNFHFKRVENEIIFETSSFENLKFYKLDSPYRFIIDIFVNQEQVDERKYNRKFTVVIDPGHGGKDLGISKNEISEKEITLLIAKELSSRLNPHNIKNFLTRNSDEYLSIKKRFEKTMNLKTGVFLSIHSSNEDIFQIYYYSKSKQDNVAVEKFIAIIRNRIEKNFQEILKIENMPVYQAKSLNLPFIMIEIPKRSLSKDKIYINKIIDTLYQSLNEFLDLKSKAGN